MTVIAIQTARGGSKSVPGKNTLDVTGKPLFLHNLGFAISSKKIDHVYISTDIAEADDYKHFGYKIVSRPQELTGDNASHYETIKHALYQSEEDIGRECEILVVLLGNNLTAFSEDLESAITMLEGDKDLDSVISVSEFNMFNPFRAYKIDGGLLNTIAPQAQIKEESKMINVNDKGAAGNTYFFNGSFWVIRRSSFIENSGLLPFSWLGKKIAPFVQCVTMEIDAEWQVDVVKKIGEGNA